MSQQYLLELGLEEVPARFLLAIRDQLGQRVETFLEDHRITYESVELFATPRRVAVRVNGLPDKQEDLRELVRGPSLKIAQDEEGQWTKAAQGFSRGQGADVEDLVIQEVKGQPYIFVDKFQEGQAVAEILPQIVQVLEALTFPVRMTWGSNHESFIRPVHWLVSLLDDQVIPFDFLDASAGRQTRGHRFLGDALDLEKAADYEEALETVYVLADFEERRQRIVEQIQTLAKENDWFIPISDGLLEEVTALVEWPTAFSGTFDPSYLEIPAIVLQTAMRDHQRYFYVLDEEEGAMQPYFVSVRNGDDYHLDNVVKGNEKVLRARLEDALFFYQEDLKEPIEDLVAKLGNVNEHYEIGSLEDKQERVVALLEAFGTRLGEDQEPALEIAKEAAAIYKFDLMTLMVNEFAELQGQMGAIYAQAHGISEPVAQAIGEQYLPNHSHGALPETEAGALLAFSDKLDTLIEYFKIGLIPSGSQDPFALRRQAMGLVEIIIDRRWFFDLDTFLGGQLGVDSEVIDSLKVFIQARINQHLDEEGIDYDIIEGISRIPYLNVLKSVTSAKVIQKIKDQEPERYVAIIEAITRVVNLGVKIADRLELMDELAQTESEARLLELMDQLPDTKDPMTRLESLSELAEPIELYFEENMVNAEDERIRRNRHAIMQSLTRYILELVDPRELISKFK